VNIAIRIEPGNGANEAPVEYRWDADTDILTAAVRQGVVGEGMTGSVEVMGSDSSCLLIDVTSGRINGVEVAVWPDVRKQTALQPPAQFEDARVTLPARASQPGIASLNVDLSLIAEADSAERTFHFRIGKARPARVVRIARDILLDVDERSRLAGVWLLNVPPFPAEQVRQ
jgi:hypothetical protein